MAFRGRHLFVRVLHSAGPDNYLTVSLIGPMAFGQWELCVLVLHYAGPDSYLALLSLVQWHFVERNLCVLVLHSAGSDSIFNITLIGPVALEDGSFEYLYYILPDQTVIKQYFDWSHGISRTGVMCSCITFCWTRQLSSTNLLSTLAFGERDLCVLVLHSA